MFGIFPLLALVVIAFNVVVFGGGLFFGLDTNAAECVNACLGDAACEVACGSNPFDLAIFSLPLVNDVWRVSLGDIFVVAALIFLFIEIAKATRTNQMSIINHVLSMMVFIVCLIEFIVLRGFGNGTFFAIMLMTLVDVIAGFTVTISAARRDLGVGEGVFAGN